MRALASQQQALLGALFAWPAGDATAELAAYARVPWARGLIAYQTNGHAVAERALAGAYPVMQQLMGEQSFGSLARALWHAHPPQHGDVGQWGGELPAFVGASEQLREEPYLSDVAQAEWAMHCCASAADRWSAPTTFALLTECEPSDVCLELAPGCSVVRSRWPVASIVNAHLDATPTLQEAGAKLRAGVGEDAVVWRAGLRPGVRQALPGEADLLMALLQQASLDVALDAAPQLDFNAWLPMAVHSGLLLGACRRASLSQTSEFLP